MFLLKIRKFVSAIAEKVMEMLGKVEESHKEQLKMALRSEVGGLIPQPARSPAPSPPSHLSVFVRA